MLGFSQVFKPIKRQDLLEKGKKGRNAFRTGAKSHFSEKNILGLVALYDGLREQRGAHFQCHGFESLRPGLFFPCNV